jgi:hypothetical protein
VQDQSIGFLGEDSVCFAQYKLRDLTHADAMAQRCRDTSYKDAKVRYRVFFSGFLKVFRFAEGMLSWLPLGEQRNARSFA